MSRVPDDKNEMAVGGLGTECAKQGKPGQNLRDRNTLDVGVEDREGQRPEAFEQGVGRGQRGRQGPR